MRGHPEMRANPTPAVTARCFAEIALCLAITCLMVWDLWWYLGVDWDFLANKHYFEGNFYGGYSSVVNVENGKLIAYSQESYYCILHESKFLDPAVGPYIGGFNVDRMFTCGFLPSLVERLSFGTFNLRTSIIAVNIAQWLIVILFSGLIVYRLTQDRVAALCVAAIMAAYPIYPLMFTGMKTQPAGAAILLMWVYLDLTIWPRLNRAERAILLVATFLASMLAAGAAYFIFVYMVVRIGYAILTGQTDRREELISLLFAIAAFMIAKVAVDILLGHHRLVTWVSQYNLGDKLRESGLFLWRKLTGGDTTGMRFLSYPGFDIVTVLLPHMIKDFVRTNPVIVLVPLAAAVFMPRLRVLAIAACLLFIVGHGHIVITAWEAYLYYGYASAPASLLLVVGLGVCIAALLKRWPPVGPAAAAAAVLASIYFYSAHPGLNFKGFYHYYAYYPAEKHFFVYHDRDGIKYW
jgi:hypothetical protein